MKMNKKEAFEIFDRIFNDKGDFKNTSYDDVLYGDNLFAVTIRKKLFYDRGIFNTFVINFLGNYIEEHNYSFKSHAVELYYDFDLNKY